MVKGLADLGIFGLTIPEAYGGYGFSSAAWIFLQTEDFALIAQRLGGVAIILC